MHSTPTIKNLQQQKGLALLVLTIVIALAFISYFVSMLSVPELRLQQEEKTIKVLNKAKQALLDYAVLFNDDFPGYYGFLPCPDINNIGTEGGSHGTCDNKYLSTLGLFPWASLETGVMRSSSGNCLWYVLSGEYKHVPAANKTDMLNEDSNGTFRIFDAQGNIIQGATPDDRVVAVIIDPGPPLPGQNRNFDDTSDCGLDYFPTEYLEGDGVIDNSLLSGGVLSIDDFINRDVGTDQLPTPFNDQLVTITRQELWDAVKSRQDFVANADSSMRRLTEALALCVAAYGENSANRKLPRPAVVDFAGGDYRIDNNYIDDVAIYSGRYPHSVNNSDAVLGVNAPDGGESTVFNKDVGGKLCNNLSVTGGPPNIDLETDDANEGYNLWKNWKDHFFYAVSDAFVPSVLPFEVCDGIGTNCISVNGTEYAAVVLFAGSRSGVQLRNEPIAGDVDTKNDTNNYLEFAGPVGGGTDDYTPTGNDVAFCVTDLLAVVDCTP